MSAFTALLDKKNKSTSRREISHLISHCLFVASESRLYTPLLGITNFVCFKSEKADTLIKLKEINFPLAFVDLFFNLMTREMWSHLTFMALLHQALHRVIYSFPQSWETSQWGAVYRNPVQMGCIILSVALQDRCKRKCVLTVHWKLNETRFTKWSSA